MKPAPLVKMLRLMITKWVVGIIIASIFISGPIREKGMSRPDKKKPEKRKIIIEAMIAANDDLLVIDVREPGEVERSAGKAKRVVDNRPKE